MNSDDDLDVDLSDNEIDNILNESEPDELDPQTSDPHHISFVANRTGGRFSSDIVRDIQEDRQRLELLLSLDKTPNKSQEKSNPLDLLHKKEYHDATVTDKLLKTSLKDKRQYQEAKLPVIQFEELKLISLKIAPPSNISSASPSALAASANLIVIGSRTGQILIFNQSGQELKQIKPRKNFGQVTCIDITDDECIIASGYHFGQVALYEVLTGKCIRACNTLHSTAVLALNFWTGSFSQLITGELCGKVALVEYGKSFMSTSISFSELLYDDVGAILSIQRLIPDPLWPHPTDSSRIVAIAGSQKVILVNLDNKPEVVYTIERPGDVSENSCPCISWNRAFCPEDSEPIDHILAVAWGGRITLYRVKFALMEGVRPAGYLETDNEIKSIAWLSSEILFVLGKSREIRIISSREMSKDFAGEQKSKRAILDETYANRDLASQLYLKKDSKDQFTYYNTIKCFGRLAMLLGNKDFQRGRLLNWKECIDELSKKNEWLEVLALGIDLYQGKGKKLYGLPKNKNELRNILQDNVRRYVKVSSIAWIHKISNAIEFCIGIESLDLLFNELFDIFIDEGGPENMKIFMNILEPFILLKEIRIIPTPILGKMVGYYLNAKLPNVLERIILNIDASCIDPNYILPACEEHNLLSTYIFISTNSSPKNFMNPVYKMHKSAQLATGKGKKYLEYKILWYIRLCIRGETFPDGRMPRELYNKTVAELVRWMSGREVLEEFFESDPEAILGVFINIFEEKAAALVLEKKYEGSLSFQDVVDALLIEKEVTSFLYYQIMTFVLKIANISYVRLQKEVYLKVAKYMMKVHKFITAPPIYATSIDDYIVNYSFRTELNQHFTDLTIEEKSSLLLVILRKCGEINDEDLSDIYKLAELSPYTEVLVYLLELKKEYSKCVNYFIRCQSEIVRKKVFNWLNEVFTKINEEDRESLKSQVMNSLGEFVEIDSDLTAKIVNDWYQGQHNEIVRKLDNAPKLQMKYLGELAKDTLEEDLVFKYVVLLCTHEPELVLTFLSSRDDYNIEECLTECLKNNVIEAAAYLHEKLGGVQDALDLLIARAESNKTLLANKLRQREFIPKELLELIHSDVKKSIELCLRNASRLDSKECEDHWFQVLKCILSFYKDFEEIFTFNPNLEPTIHNLIKEILEHMMACVDFNKIISFITKSFEKIPFKHFKENIYQVLAQHSYQKNIVRQAIGLLGNDVKGMTSNLFNYKNRGVKTQEFCGACSGKLTSERVSHDKFVIFICGHGFHARCARDYSCAVCMESNRRKGENVFVNARKRNH